MMLELLYFVGIGLGLGLGCDSFAVISCAGTRNIVLLSFCHAQ